MPLPQQNTLGLHSSRNAHLFLPKSKSSSKLHDSSFYSVCLVETHVYTSPPRSAAPLVLCIPPDPTSPFSGSYIPRIKYATQKPVGPLRNKEDSYRGNLEQQPHTTSPLMDRTLREAGAQVLFSFKTEPKKEKLESANVFKFKENHLTKCSFISRGLYEICSSDVSCLANISASSGKEITIFLIMPSDILTVYSQQSNSFGEVLKVIQQTYCPLCMHVNY